MAAAPHPRSTRALALAGLLATLACPAGQAAPVGALPVAGPTASPQAFGSPLVTIERIDAGAAARPVGPGGAAGPDGPDGLPAIILLDPDMVTAIGQVGPPDGGNLIMVVE